PNNLPPPSLDFRFCNFYLRVASYHFWSGISPFTPQHLNSSYFSALYLNLKDCSLHGGIINLGQIETAVPLNIPGNFQFASLALTNNLFDRVTTWIAPTLNAVEFGSSSYDFSFAARNNLFH